MKTFPYRMNVGQVHKLNLTAWIVLGTLASPSPRSVGHGRRIRPCIHYQHFLLLLHSRVGWNRKRLGRFFRIGRSGRRGNIIQHSTRTSVECASVWYGFEKVLVLGRTPTQPTDLRLAAACYHCSITHMPIIGSIQDARQAINQPMCVFTSRRRWECAWNSETWQLFQASRQWYKQEQAVGADS